MNTQCADFGFGAREVRLSSKQNRIAFHSVNILGISAYYHDSASARFPVHAIKYCLNEGRISLADLDYIVFYDKPLVRFDRFLEIHIGYAPSGIRSFLKAMPIWLKEKLDLKMLLRKELAQIRDSDMKSLPALMFTEHHLTNH